MALQRIIVRDGGVPSFELLREMVTAIHGYGRGYCDTVLNNLCARNRPLRYQKVSESQASRFKHDQSLVMMSFYLTKNQRDRFQAFMRGILLKSYILLDAVLLLMYPVEDHLVSMNSRGSKMDQYFKRAIFMGGSCKRKLSALNREVTVPIPARHRECVNCHQLTEIPDLFAKVCSSCSLGYLPLIV